VSPRRILALGGGGFSGSVEDAPLDEYVVTLAASERPRICLIPTASGDPEAQIARFYGAYEPLGCELSHVSLFRLGSRPVDLRDHLLSRDVIYVGGGSMLNMLAVWRVHGVDALLAEAWQRGVALVGVSAGCMCWFEAGITRTRGVPGPAAGLGLLPFTISVHDGNDPARNAEYRKRIAEGMAGGFAVEDGVGLLFEGGDLAEAVSARPGAGAHRVELRGGRVVQEVIEPRLLGASGDDGASLEPVAISEFREAAQRRSRPSRNSLRSTPPV
jgi:dipeptidase E